MSAMPDSTMQHPRYSDTDHPSHPQPPPMPQQRLRDTRSKAPSLAAVLSLVPGLGQVYVGYYQRGFVHAVVVATLITVLASGTIGALTPLFALFMVFFWLYNVIDAARRASLYNDALAGNQAIELPRDFTSPGFGGSIFGGVALIAAGVILLLHTRFGMSLDWVEVWWPVAPMLFGAWLIFRAVQERQGSGAGEAR